MTKITTEDAMIFLSEYYKNNGINIPTENWELTKKYKNFKGFTCRDFFSEKDKKRAIVVIESDSDIPQVIENENYEFFLRMLANQPLYYYVPTICNDGLVFVFEPVSSFDKTGKLSIDTQHHKSLLTKKLNSMYREEDVFSLTSGLMFAFPNSDMDEVISHLEKNQMTFNIKLFDCLDQEIFQPIVPDVTLASYRFPADEKLNQEESITIVFKIISQKREFTVEDYARIKFLLKKIKADEFPTVRKIALGFRKGRDERLLSIFESEANRKKAQELVKEICIRKGKK